MARRKRFSAKFKRQALRREISYDKRQGTSPTDDGASLLNRASQEIALVREYLIARIGLHLKTD